MARKIIIYSTSKPRISKSILKELTIRNTVIEYIPIPIPISISISITKKSNINSNDSSRTRLELYGYDGLKYEVKNIFSLHQLTKELNIYIAKIDKMPMGLLELQERQIHNKTQKKKQAQKVNNKSCAKLLQKCRLSDIPETRHCFADYVDASGNPIGSLSSKVQAIKNYKKTQKKILTNKMNKNE
jgi:hypothetical protein